MKTEFISTYRVSYTAAFNGHRRYKRSRIPTGIIQSNQTWYYHVSHRIEFSHTSRALNVSKKDIKLLLVHSPPKEPNSYNSSAGPINSAKLALMISCRKMPSLLIRDLLSTVLKNQASSHPLIHVTFSIHSQMVVRCLI